MFTVIITVLVLLYKAVCLYGMQIEPVVVMIVCQLPGRIPFDKVGDARLLAKGYKSRILV